MTVVLVSLAWLAVGIAIARWELTRMSPDELCGAVEGTPFTTQNAGAVFTATVAVLWPVWLITKLAGQ